VHGEFDDGAILAKCRIRVAGAQVGRPMQVVEQRGGDSIVIDDPSLGRWRPLPHDGLDVWELLDIWDVTRCPQCGAPGHRLPDGAARVTACSTCGKTWERADYDSVAERIDDVLRFAGAGDVDEFEALLNDRTVLDSAIEESSEQFLVPRFGTRGIYVEYPFTLHEFWAEVRRVEAEAIEELIEYAATADERADAERRVDAANRRWLSPPRGSIRARG
jgi:hypothetical protein